MPPEQSCDRHLAKRIAAGDEAGFRELYALHASRIHAYAARRLGDRAEAEDAVQDVFLAVHRSIGSFAGRSSLLTWMFGIARNEVGHRLRRRRRTPLPSSFDLPASTVADEVPSDRRVDASRALAACASALERDVTPAQREIFDLYYGTSDATPVIAEKLGRTDPAVKMSLSRTRRLLKERLADR